MDISSQMKVKLAFDSKIYHQLSLQLSILDTFKGSWMMKENLEGRYLKELQKIATIESIGALTRMEGAKLKDEELGKLLARIQVTRFESHDEQAVAGYYDALQVILENFTDIEISEQFIHQIPHIEKGRCLI